MENCTARYAERIQSLPDQEYIAALSLMCRYIDRTPAKKVFTDNCHWQLYINELCSLESLAKVDFFAAIIIAFRYGRAMGYRAAHRRKKAST